MSNSLWPHGLQHARLSCPSLTPRVYENSCHWDGDAIQQSHPLSSPSSLVFSLSQHQGLFHELVLCIRWPKYGSFNFSISPFSEYSGLISLRIDWLDLLAVQAIVKSLLQHQSSNNYLASADCFKIQCWQISKRASALVAEMGLTLASIGSREIHIGIWPH